MSRQSTTTALSRRAVLRGSLLGLPLGVGLPVLDAMLDGHGEALAAGDPLPKRFGTWFWGGGVGTSDIFFPTTPGRDFQLTPMLQPLANVREYLTLVRGPAMSTPNPGGHWHHRGKSLGNSYTPDPGTTAGYPGQPGAPSVDQVAAAAWQGRTLFDSLQLGLLSNGVHHSSSWKAPPYQMLRPDTDPRSVYTRLFSRGLPGTTAPAQSLDAVLAANRSLLDGTMASATRLAARVGARDRQRLDAHLEGLRAIERRLAAPAPSARGCTTPAAPTLAPAGTNAPNENVHRALSDLLVVALSCDLTRVFSYMYTGAQDDTIYAPVGVTAPYHSSGHDTTWYMANTPLILPYIMKQYAYLLERLKATPEGTGNLLDRTLIYGTTEFQTAPRHSESDHPFVLAGRAGGAVAGGTYVKTATAGKRLGPGVPSIGTVMLASLLAVDVPVKAVGSLEKNPLDYATDPLPGILKGT